MIQRIIKILLESLGNLVLNFLQRVSEMVEGPRWMLLVASALVSLAMVASPWLVAGISSAFLAAGATDITRFEHALLSLVLMAGVLWCMAHVSEVVLFIGLVAAWDAVRRVYQRYLFLEQQYEQVVPEG